MQRKRVADLNRGEQVITRQGTEQFAVQTVLHYTSSLGRAMGIEVIDQTGESRTFAPDARVWVAA